MRAQDINTAATSGFGAEMCASECVTQLIACQDNPMLAAQHDQIAQLVSPTDYSPCSPCSPLARAMIFCHTVTIVMMAVT